MFTGIIEAVGQVESIKQEGTNIHFGIHSPFGQELKIDQSVAHNGVCLTITSIAGNFHEATAIQETLEKTNLKDLTVGSLVNLERCLRMGDRLDGHLVQGHVDTTGKVEEIIKVDGSWSIHIRYEAEKGLTVKKGSICMNGISLTVVDSGPGYFSVAIIPFTWDHTSLRQLKVGDRVNLEFDMVGKYIVELFDRNIRQFNMP